jgi:hypothetical protein
MSEPDMNVTPLASQRRESGPLWSVFDGLSPDAPLDLAAVECAMERDFECRALACLDRILAKRGLS